MKRTNLTKETYYLVSNTGYNNQALFRDEEDMIRFLFVALYSQSSYTFRNVSRITRVYAKNNTFGISSDIKAKIVKEREVELVNFSLVPHAFFLTLFNMSKDSISKYMHRVQNAYGKYYNHRYKKVGYVFSGPYEAQLLESDDLVKEYSGEVHVAPYKEDVAQEKDFSYSWSSLSDYIEDNRWEGLLKPDVVLQDFKGDHEYRDFVRGLL